MDRFSFSLSLSQSQEVDSLVQLRGVSIQDLCPVCFVDFLLLFVYESRYKTRRRGKESLNFPGIVKLILVKYNSFHMPKTSSIRLARNEPSG